MDNIQSTKLVHHMTSRQQSQVAYEAASRTWHLWPDNEDGRLAHAVFTELLKDLANPKAYAQACKDWHWAGEHWYVTPHGLSREYLHNILVGWGFIPDNIPLHNETLYDYQVGLEDDAEQKRCRRCKELQPRKNFAADRTQVDGKRNLCKNCTIIRRHELATERAKKAGK